MSKIISKLFVTIILLAIMPVVSAGPPVLGGVPCIPTYLGEIFQPNAGIAEVNGIIDNNEWDTDEDFVKKMRETGEHNANAYLLYDDDGQTLYVMVLSEGDNVIDTTGNHFVEDICGNKILVGDSSPEGYFHYITENEIIIGWEAKIIFESKPNELQVKVKTQVVGENNESFMAQCLFKPPEPIPEFPTIALPIAAILGLMFILQSRRRKED
jgi:hypothetical protein